MGKSFYGVGSEVQEGIELKDTNVPQRICIIILFVDVVLAILFLFWGIRSYSVNMTKVGVVFAGLLPSFLCLTIYIFFSPKNRKQKATKICMFVFPFIGFYIMIAYFLCLNAFDQRLFILKAATLAGTLAFGGPGAGMVLSFMLGQRNGKRYTQKVKGICDKVDEQRVLQNMTEDIYQSKYDHDMNKMSLFVPTFRYEYQGIEYSKTMDYGYGNLNNAYEEGKEIEVYIDPNNPEDMMLYPGGNGFILLMGIGFLIGGAIWLVCFLLFLFGVLY